MTVQAKKKPKTWPGWKQLQQPYVPEDWHQMIVAAAKKKDRKISYWLRDAIYNALRRQGFQPSDPREHE